MKKTALALIFILLFTSLGACAGLPAQNSGAASPGAEASRAPGGSQPADKAAYTVMIYVDGANLESESGLASMDLGEMVSAATKPSTVNVVVQTGGALNWHASGIPNDAIGRYLVVNGGIQELERLPQQNMTLPATLTDFINFGYQNYPAERYGLVMWDHGAGPLYGYGMDENYGQESIMPLSGLASALQASAVAGQPLEFLGFDSCLMASIEIASLLSPYARYMIASQDLEPGEGWDYSAWLGALSRDPAMDGAALGKIIADSYVQYYTTRGQEDAPLMLSVVDLSKTQAVVTALEAFVGEADLAKMDFQQVAQRREATKEFGYMPQSGPGRYDLVDIGDMAGRFSTSNAAVSAALISALEQAVVYSTKGRHVDIANGLSIYFPFNNRYALEQNMALYKDTGFSPVYVNYLTNFVKTLGGSAIAPMDEVSRMRPARGGTAGGEGYHITLAPEQAGNIREAWFAVWQRLENGSYRQIYQDNSVHIDAETGDILTAFSGKITAVNSEAACLYESERGEGYVRYWAPAAVNGSDVNLLLIFDGANPEGRVVGAVPVYPDTNRAARELWELKEGDKLAMAYYTQPYPPGEDENGAEEPHWFGGEARAVGSTLPVETVDVPPGEYLYGFILTDWQGYTYESEYISVNF